MNAKKLYRHLLLALGLGFLARTVTAYLVYGAQSVDDYSHGVLPALEAARGWETQIPLWRSPLLVWVLTGVVKLSGLLGIESVFGSVRFMFFVLGLFSLLSVWAYYRYYARPLMELEGRILASGMGKAARERLALLALYLLSLHFILTFAGTRAFGESIAMTLVPFGLFMMEWSLDRKDQRVTFFLGGLLLGLACLFRFQVGLLAVGYAAYLLLLRRTREFGLLALAGFISLILEGGIDWIYDRWPLETLYNYLYVNKDGAVEHTVQPWYHTWFTVLPFWFLPLSLPFLKDLRSLTRTEKVFIAITIFFVFMHSLIPHKEERFLAPVLPLLIFTFAGLWARSWGTFYEKWIFRPFAVLILAFGLFVSSTSNSQSGEYAPFLMAEKEPGQVILWDWKSVLQESYFRDRLLTLVGPKIEYQVGDRWPTATEVELFRLRADSVFFVTSEPGHRAALEESLRSLEGLLRCEPIQRIQSLADRVIYSMNPQYNQRRLPTWLAVCRWPAS